MPSSNAEEHSDSKINDDITRLKDEIQRISNKLKNSGFVAKAPAATIEKEKIRLAGCEKNLQLLQSQ